MPFMSSARTARTDGEHFFEGLMTPESGFFSTLDVFVPFIRWEASLAASNPYSPRGTSRLP
jgi:hypothetical protein